MNIKKITTAVLATSMAVSMMALTGCANESAKPVTEEKDFDESFSNIEIDTSMEDIKFLKSEDDECHVIFAHADSIKTTIEVNGDTLVIKEKSNFNLFSSFNFSSNDVYLEIYLPEDSYEKLDVDVASSDVRCEEGITFEVIDIDIASGDIYLADMTPDTIEIDTASGNVCFTNVVAGSINVDSASGDIIFEASDADEIDIDTASGNVEGTLLTGKDFDIDTASGDINVPRSSDGGSCKIDTASGDVDLDIV